MSMPNYDWLGLAKDPKTTLTIFAIAFAVAVYALVAYLDVYAR